MVLWGFAKSKAINFSFKDHFDRSICNFQRLARQKTIQIRSSSRLQHAGTRFNSKKSLHANITETELSLFNVLAKIQVTNCRTLFF